MKINKIAERVDRIYDIACSISIIIFGPLILFVIGLSIWDRIVY